MEVLIGTHSGLLKLIKVNTLKYTSHQTQALQKAIVSITPVQNDTCLVARKNGILSIWDYTTQAQKGRTSLDLQSEVVSTYSHDERVVLGLKNSSILVRPPLSEEQTKAVCQIQVKSPELNKLKHLDGNLCGAASKDATFQIWDIAEQKRIWKARNLPNDELDLPVPIYDTDFCGIPTNPRHSFVCVTAEGEIREYDRRIKSRPVINQTLENKMYLSCVAPCQTRSHLIFVGDQSGFVNMCDRRKSLKTALRLRGARGTMKYVESKGSRVIGCSLDGFFYSWDYIDTTQQEVKLFLRQRLTQACIRGNKESTKKKEDDEESKEEEKREPKKRKKKN